MEFHEKLQELRKNRGLTQEELAEALYVSRTAVSKWESGRGYPNIDSLKAISTYFSVTIDQLLSSEKLLSIAEKENQSNLQNLCHLLFGMVDLCAFLLIVLPLYPNTMEAFIYSVNLFAYTEATPFHRALSWMMFLTLIGVGILQIIRIKFQPEKNPKILVEFSMGLHILTVLFLALTRETYATTVAFLLFVIKGMLLLKCLKTNH